MKHPYDPLTNVCSLCGIHAREAVDRDREDCPMDSTAYGEHEDRRRNRRATLLHAPHIPSMHARIVEDQYGIERLQYAPIDAAGNEITR